MVATLAGLMDAIGHALHTLAARIHALEMRETNPSQHNLLVNPGFELWQRGAGAFTAHNAYTADRWQIVLGGSSTLSVSRNTANVDSGSQYCAACTYVHNAASQLLQTLEGYTQLRGRTITASVRVNTATASAVRISVWDSVNGYRYSDYHSGGGTYETLTVSAPIAAAATGAQVAAFFDASCTAYIDNATLIVGSIAADYVPLLPSEDLARCQRYYELLTGGAAGTHLGAGHALTTARAFAGIHFVPKAVVPTLTVSAVGDFRVVYGNALTATPGTISLANARAHAAILDFNTVTGSPLTAGQGVYFDTGNANSTMSLEANP